MLCFSISWQLHFTAVCPGEVGRGGVSLDAAWSPPPPGQRGINVRSSTPPPNRSPSLLKQLVPSHSHGDPQPSRTSGKQRDGKNVLGEGGRGDKGRTSKPNKLGGLLLRSHWYLQLQVHMSHHKHD